MRGSCALLLTLACSSTGWIDLTPGPNLEGWRRVAMPTDKPLAAQNPWTFDAATRTLRCDAEGIIEMLLCERDFGDGVFHVEWRFRKGDEKTVYNSGVFVRTTADGKTWFQAQVAHGNKNANVGDLILNHWTDGKDDRTFVRSTRPDRSHPPGDWNTYDIACAGPRIELSVNGGVTASVDAWPVSVGRIGVQAELWHLEFRNLRFMPAR